MPATSSFVVAMSVEDGSGSALAVFNLEGNLVIG
jgi:hypothetical protein